MSPKGAWKPRLEQTGEPRYAALLTALAADVGSGALKPGERLPTQRELAASTGFSLGTVTRAYAAAEERGLVRGEVGRGTFVRDLTDPTSYTPQLDRSRIDLGPTAAPIEPGDLGQRSLQAALVQLSRRADLGALSGYQSHGGSREQQAAAAKWLTSGGLEADDDDITICGGAQHATFIALSVLARGGVFTEALTYPGLVSAAHSLGVRLHALPLDDDGLLPGAFDRACRETTTRVLYCQPANHNPLTTIMPAARRAEIVAIARRHGVTIIENATLAPLVAGAPAPIAAMAPELTWHLGSLSKVTVPALRVGFIRTPPGRRQDAVNMVTGTTWCVSPLLAEIAARWMTDGTAAAIRDARRAEAAERFRIAKQALRGRAFRGHPAGYFVWLELPEGRSALDVVSEARDLGVLIGPAHIFAADPAAAPNAVRISLGAAASRAELANGLDVLTRLIDRSR